VWATGFEGLTRVVKLTKADIVRLFELLDAELSRQGIEGEVYLVGGAVMRLALNARGATNEVDAFFKPTKAIREASARIAAQADVPDNWLNDAVKGYLSPRGEFAEYIELTTPSSVCRQARVSPGDEVCLHADWAKSSTTWTTCGSCFVTSTSTKPKTRRRLSCSTTTIHNSSPKRAWRSKGC